MLDSSVLFAFVPAAIAIVVAPGPDTIYTLTSSIGSGRLAGVAAATGTATGVLVHTAAAVVGLSALLRTSALAYTVVKYAGAAYLVYLGIQLFRNPGDFEIQEDRTGPDSSPRAVYARAVAINVSNPKVAVFVLAFFPQFVPASANAPLQMSVLGIVYAALGLCYLSGVAMFASRARHLVTESSIFTKVIAYASGSVLVAFGLKLAIEERPTA